MTRREIAMMACRIVALWMFAQSMLSASGVVLMLILAIWSVVSDFGYAWDSLATAMASAIPASVIALCGLLFWIKAPKLAARMVSDDPAPVTRPDMTRADIMAVAYSATGVFLLVPALRDFAGCIFDMLSDRYRISELWSSPRWQASFWWSIVGVGLALWLMLGARGIVQVVLMARAAAARRSSDRLEEASSQDSSTPDQRE